MARMQKPTPGKLVVSVIYSSMDALADAVLALEKKYGRVQCETLEIACCDSELYKEEMGDNLLRRFLSFDKDVDRGSLVELKSVCQKIEMMFSDVVDDYNFRTVNIDPCILTPYNIVMASHNEANYHIYLKDGVFAELALIYNRGQYLRLPWTNSDFCDEEAINFFSRVREFFEIIEPVEA